MAPWPPHGGSYAQPSPWSRDQKAAPFDEWAQWQCSHCRSSNWCNYGSQKKRCRTCGINKSYRDAAAPTAQPNRADWAAAAPCVPPGPTAPLAPPPPLQLDRKDLIAGIKELEALYASVPRDPGLADVKAGIADKITEKKRTLLLAKPIGARLDSSRGYVARCQARREAALADLSAARSTFEESEVALAEALSSLSALEAEMAHPEPSAQRSDSIETMAASLTRVISEMRDTCTIPPELIVETERHMRHLMDGVRIIADAASRPSTQAPASGAGCRGPPPTPPQASHATRAAPQPVRVGARRTKIVGKRRLVSLIGLRTKIVGKSKPKAPQAVHMDLDGAPATARGNARAIGSIGPGQPCL